MAQNKNLKSPQRRWLQDQERGSILSFSRTLGTHSTLMKKLSYRSQRDHDTLYVGGSLANAAKVYEKSRIWKSFGWM